MKKTNFMTMILGISFFMLLINPTTSFAQNSDANTEISIIELQNMKNNAFQQLLRLKTYNKISVDNFYNALNNLENAESEKDIFVVLISIEGTNEYNKLSQIRNSAFQQFLNYSASDKLSNENFNLLVGKLQLTNSEEEVNLVLALSEDIIQTEQDLKTAKNECFQKALNYRVKGKISSKRFNLIIENLQKVNSKEEVNEILLELK